jgi:hypothetical protein
LKKNEKDEKSKKYNGWKCKILKMNDENWMICESLHLMHYSICHANFDSQMMNGLGL